MDAKTAIVLDNFFPQEEYIELRRGFKAHSLLLNSESEQLTAPVETLMAYHGLTDAQDKLFAACGTAIYNVTEGGPAFGVITSETSLSNARFQHVNVATTGGQFLVCVNGVETRVFNGTAWSTPTFTGYTGAPFVNVNVFKRRLWFIVRDSMKAVYTAPDAFQGALTAYDFAGIFSKGGRLVAMGTWTIDGGTGADDHAVFISSEGQVAVYSGIDPSSADSWQLVGVYDLGEPLGLRCFTKVGGDLALICSDGVLPLSRALSQDRAAAEQISLTSNIQRAMNDAARAFGNLFGWQIISYPRGTCAILNVPTIEGEAAQQFVINVNSGAWCRYTGQNAICWEVFQGRLFFGANGGRVNHADSAATDDQVPIVASVKTAFSYFRSRGSVKRFTALRPLIVSDGQVTPSVTINTDFEHIPPPQITSTPLSVGSNWDEVNWDEFLWANDTVLSKQFSNASGLGQCASVFLTVEGAVVSDARWDISRWDQARWDGQTKERLKLEINEFSITYETGDFF